MAWRDAPSADRVTVAAAIHAAAFPSQRASSNVESDVKFDGAWTLSVAPRTGSAAGATSTDTAGDQPAGSGAASAWPLTRVSFTFASASSEPAESPIDVACRTGRGGS